MNMGKPLSGVILAYRGKSIVSRLIELQTRSPYSHVAIEFPGHGVWESWMPAGVRKVDHYLDGHTPGTPVDVFAVDGDVPWVAVWDFCHAQQGAGYDWRGVFRFLSRRPAPVNGRWFCSELVAAAFIEASLPLLNAAIDPAYLSPRDIVLSPMLELVERRH